DILGGEEEGQLLVAHVGLKVIVEAEFPLQIELHLIYLPSAIMHQGSSVGTQHATTTSGRVPETPIPQPPIVATS
ncbi:hypothetical protein HAX54_004530, partial [Datura stramonium]|nr:hypothetical protein [Datura stramonium]